MAVDLAKAKEHLNITFDTDDELISRLILAAMAFLLGQTGRDDLFDSMDAAVDQAVLLLVGHYYTNREASLVSGSASELPLGVAEVIDNNRAYSWGEDE